MQSLFWSIPALVVAIACTVVVVIHPVPKDVAYGIGKHYRCPEFRYPSNTTNTTYTGWGVPFVWVGIWVVITIPWVRHDMHMETVTWEEDCNIVPGAKEKEKQMAIEPNDSDRDTPKDPVPEPEP